MDPKDVLDPFSQLPPDIEHLDRVSREQWSLVMARVFLAAWSKDLLRDIIAGGEQRFIATARKACRQQAMRAGDYGRIFQILRMHAGRGPWQRGLGPTESHAVN